MSLAVPVTLAGTLSVPLLDFLTHDADIEASVHTTSRSDALERLQNPLGLGCCIPGFLLVLGDCFLQLRLLCSSILSSGLPAAQHM